MVLILTFEFAHGNKSPRMNMDAIAPPVIPVTLTNICKSCEKFINSIRKILLKLKIII